MKIIILVLLSLVIFACENESPKHTFEKVKQNSVEVTAKQPYIPPAIGANESESFKRYFDEKERTALLKIKQDFEKGMCEEQKTNDLTNCYKRHARTIQSDFIQQIPIKFTFPYESDYQLDKVEVKAVLSSVWTDKCGYKTDTGTVNYFCVDAGAKIMDYYKEVAQESDYIGNYAESYIKYKTLTESQTSSLLMSSGENLDFENFDHQLFYAILHLTWNEENKALKKMK